MTARRLVLITAALMLGQTGPSAGAMVDDELRIAGIGLSTSLMAFLDRFPEARIEQFEAVRFCYGNAVSIQPLRRVVGIVTTATHRLHVEFRRRGDSVRAVRIRAQRILSVETLDFASIRDNLVVRHGAYDRLVIRRKMEPAGLLFGFEWRRGDSAFLSVMIHHDHAGNLDRLLESVLLTDQLPGMRPAIEAAAQARQVIDEFHRTCSQRANSAE